MVVILQCWLLGDARAASVGLRQEDTGRYRYEGGGGTAVGREEVRSCKKEGEKSIPVKNKIGRTLRKFGVHEAVLIRSKLLRFHFRSQLTFLFSAVFALLPCCSWSASLCSKAAERSSSLSRQEDRAETGDLAKKVLKMI